MNLPILRRPARLVLFALLSLPCAVCPAQEDAPKASHPVRSEYIISIDFPGGPFSKLVAELNKQGKLSIIQTPGLDPMLPAFSVRDAETASVMAALGQLLEPQGYQLNPTGPGLAVLARRERGQAFASFQLESKIGARAGSTVEDVIAAIQQGCEFANDGKASTLRFKYHPATKLLFVAGTERDVDVAHRVFGSLPNANVKEPTAPPQPDKK